MRDILYYQSLITRIRALIDNGRTYEKVPHPSSVIPG
jgi:hypothetical protein